MAPVNGSSAPIRTPLDAASARHSPYATSQRNTLRKPKSDSISHSSSSSWLSRVSSGSSRSSLSRACLRPTASMVEEFEVEGLLGTIHRSDSIQSAQTFHSALSGDSQLFQSCHSSFMSAGPPPSAPTSYSKGAPLSRTSTTATVLEFPEGPTDPSYGTFDIRLPTLTEFSDSESVDSRGEDSWVDTAKEMDASIAVPLTLDMTFRSPLPDGPDSDDDDTGMDATIVPLPLEYHDSTDSACSSAAPSTSDLSLSSQDSPRKRIWEISPEEYVPRPKGAPARSVASVLEIGMQWEREHQGRTRARGAENTANPAVGYTRRIYGDAQYMN